MIECLRALHLCQACGDSVLPQKVHKGFVLGAVDRFRHGRSYEGVTA